MRIYIFIWAMLSFSMQGLQAVLLNLYLTHLGYDTATIGRFLAFPQVVFGLMALPAGMLGARLGPRAGLLTGTSALAIGWSVFLLSTNLPPEWMNTGMTIGLCIAYTGHAHMIVNGAPYFMCITKNDDSRVHYLSLQQAFQALLALVGGMVAGALPGFLVSFNGGQKSDADFYGTVLWLIPTAYVVASLALLHARRVRVQTPASGEETQSQPFPWKSFIFYPVVVFLVIVGDTGARTFYNLYLVELGLSTGQIGTLYGITQLAPFITALMITAVIQRIGISKTFSTGALLLSVFILFPTISASPAVASIGLGFLALMSTVMNATRSLFGQELVEGRWRTFIAAAGTISMASGTACSSMIGGSIIAAQGYHSLFRLSAGLALVAGVISFTYLYLTGRAAKKQAAEARSTTQPVH